MEKSPSTAPFSSVKSAATIRAIQVKDDDEDRYDDMGQRDSRERLYDDYDDFAIGMSGNTSGGGNGGVATQRQRPKTNHQQIYSSKHTRLRENRISTAKAPSKR